MKGRLMLWTVPYMLIAASVLQVSSGALCDFTPPGTAQLFEYSPPATVVLELTVEGTPEVNISLSLDSVLSEFFEWNEKKLLTKSGQNITKPADTDASGLISGEARCFLVGNALPEEIISLRVNVIDINQVNPIEFSQSSYTETFAESAAINDTFFQVVATDPDVDSSDITYNITEQNPPDYFSLARSNLGNVYLRKQLDYRDVQRIVMTIEASSSGADGKEGIWKDTTTVQATVMVDDEDNYPPQFNPCQLVSGNVCFPPLYTTSVKRYQINVLDNIQPGPISAEDLDAGVNAAISYSFISGDHDEYFAIDSSNGEVTMKKEINDPNISQFTISVRAEEATGKSSFAYFVVDVTTADDFKPIFEENSYSGFIQDNSQNLYSIVTKDEDGTIPLQIKAADPDDGNAEILYQITSPFQVTSDGYVYYSPSSSAPFATTIPDGEVTAINLNADVGSSNRRSDPIVLTVIAIEPATTPEPTTPEPTTPEPTTPEPTTPEPTTPEPTTPEPTTPEPTTQEITTPKPTTAEPTTPEPTTPEIITPEPTTAEPTTPEPTTPELTTPEPTTPELTTPELTTVEPTTPEPTTSELTTPEPTTPESTTTTTTSTGATDEGVTSQSTIGVISTSGSTQDITTPETVTCPTCEACLEITTTQDVTTPQTETCPTCQACPEITTLQDVTTPQIETCPTCEACPEMTTTRGLEEPGEPTTCSPSPSCPEITTGEGEVILPPGTVSASTLYGVAGGLGAGLLICIIIIIVIGSFLYKRSKSPPDTESFVSTTASSTHHNNTAFEDEISPNGKVPHEEIPESTYVMAADVEPVAETTETTVNDDTTSPAHQYENVVPETRTPEPEVVEPEYQPINVETEVPEPPAEESEAPAAFTSFAAVPAVPVAAKVYSNLPDPFFDDGEIQDYGSAFKRNQIRIEKILAEGKYGETRLVTIEKYGIERKDTKAVAKILKLNIAPGTHVSSCHAQIGLMKEACEQEHDNILQFCGMLENENEIHCAMAYTPNGTLENYLKPGANHSKLTANQMMRIISGVAKGLQFLHAKNIVHCNLQSRSIMLDEELMPKLRDYENNEVSAIKEDDDRLRWQALEVLNGDLSNTGSDIWSCGVVMWHVASRGETPYTKVEDKDIIPHLTNNYRLTKPSGCSQSLFGLMESCWNADPRLRPDIYVIVTNLEEKLMEDANELFGLDVSSNLDPTYVNITVEGSTSNHSVLSSFKNVDEDSTML